MNGTNAGNKTTRDFIVQALVFLLSLSILFHGVFFFWEWLILGAGLSFLAAGCLVAERPRRKFQQRDWNRQQHQKADDLGESQRWAVFVTDVLLAALILLSLLGMLHPVKAGEGAFDALRWFCCWLVYRIARQIFDHERQRIMTDWLVRIAVLLAILVWLPHLGRFALFERLALQVLGYSGYANAAAAFLGAVLLLTPLSAGARMLLFLTLLQTGSRAALVLFLLVWLGRTLCFELPVKFNLGRGRQRRDFAGFFAAAGLRSYVLLLIGLPMMSWLNPQGIEKLMDWSLSASLGERFLYLRDGLQLAVLNQGLPRAGGWWAFPLVQNIPYWVSDPHSLPIRILLHQGLAGLVGMVIWGILLLRSGLRKLATSPAILGSSEKVVIVRSLSALLFLGLHAAVDADFLFGALAILFWLVFGMLSARQGLETVLYPWQLRRFTFKPLWFTDYPLKSMVLRNALLLLGGIFLLSAAVQPELSQSGKPLAQDQNPIALSREHAVHSLRGLGAKGLPAVEEALDWQKFDLRAYEWAQGRVLEEAEKRKTDSPDEALLLYAWVEDVVQRIDRTNRLTPLEKKIWPTYGSFKPSDLNQLLADFAREKIAGQRSLPSPPT